MKCHNVVSNGQKHEHHFEDNKENRHIIDVKTEIYKTHREDETCEYMRKHKMYVN